MKWKSIWLPYSVVVWKLTVGFSWYVEIPHGSPFRGTATEVVCSGSWLGDRMVTQALNPSSLPPQIRAEDRFLRTEQGLLLRALQPADQGLYSCTATENNFKHVVTRVQLHVLGRDAVHAALFPPPAVSAPPPPGAGLPTPPYQELAQLLAQPEVGLIHQYCQGYWRHVPPSPREAPGAPRPPEPQDQKKPRNRRHHPPDT